VDFRLAVAGDFEERRSPSDAHRPWTRCGVNVVPPSDLALTPPTTSKRPERVAFSNERSLMSMPLRIVDGDQLKARAEACRLNVIAWEQVLVEAV
jgi:hypothetical protein